MDWKLLRGTGRPGPCRVPNSYFGDYFSHGFSTAPEDQWVTGRFSSSDENVLFIGSDTGHVCVIDVDAPPQEPAEAIKYFFRAHPGVVMDILPVPGNREELLTMSGSDIRIWTLGEPIKSSLYLGHDKSVRAATFAPDNSNLFATGGRDGCIFMWDRRVAPLSQNGQAYRRPFKEYRNCHQIKPHPMSTAVGGGRRRSERLVPPRASSSITSMTYLNEHTIITASESRKSGIRLWDTRRPPVREESRPLAVLEVPSNREVGVSSICLDRYKSSLFAVATDNCIHEYYPNTCNTEPVRSYVGACIDADFYMQMACSPISDHIMCGSGDKRALVWDAQKHHSYADQPLTGPASTSQKGIRPSLSLGGHNRKVCTVGYSAHATYMLTMDDREFRVWRHMPVSRNSLRDAQENLGAAFERVERIEQPKEDEASSVLEKFSITPGPRLFLSPTKAGMAPLQKRKEPFASPFKSSAAMRLFDEKENIPPGTKLTKLDNVSLPSLEEEEREEEEQRRREEERRRKREEGRGNPFYYKHPLMHLPNLVYDRYVDRLRGAGGEKVVETEAVTKSGRKAKTLDNWTRPAGGRLCKESLAPIAEHPAAAAAAGGGSFEQMPPASPRKLQLRLQPAAPATPGGTAAKSRRTSGRNILDYYFQTANRGSNDL